MDKTSRRKVIELLLWMTDRPLKMGEFKDILGEADCPPEDELRQEIGDIGKELDVRESPLQLMEVAEGFQLSSRAMYSPWVRRLYKEKTALRLSPSALETLSIVAYKQPITRGEVEEIRGVEGSSVLENLLERRLLKIVGRKETLGRPLLYGTTTEFMRQFGLKSLTELPKLDELVPPEDVASAAPAAEPAAEAEMAAVDSGGESSPETPSTN
jgi:segregation and condensation protein B